jgi:hypothetical protein
MENIDTRTHYEVPVVLTLKVENEVEAQELGDAIASFLVQSVKGVSQTFPPHVGAATPKA